MCGRFSIGGLSIITEGLFNAKFNFEFVPRYNAAPSQMLPVIFNTSPNEINQAKWGLIPPWAVKFRKDGIINVRKETLINKPTFQSDLNNRRCLVLSDGFYEWQRVSKNKIPYRFVLSDKKPFALAGLWEKNKLPNGEEINTFAIITTNANSLVGKIHDRMPVILERGIEKEWLEKPSLDLLKSFSPKQMEMYQVSNTINNAKIDKAELIQPVKV